MARKATIKLRQDTYENFKADASGDGILQGEPVYLTDKKALVVGDGVNGVAGHPTLIPVGNYHNTEVDGWTVTKDNNDIERKFWKDDFSVDSSSQYTGDVASFTWDTANGKLLTNGSDKKYLYGKSKLDSKGVASTVVNWTHHTNAHNEILLLFGMDDSNTGYAVDVDVVAAGNIGSLLYPMVNGVRGASSIHSFGGGIPISDGVDIRFEVRYSNGSIKFYVNGVQHGTEYTAISSITGDRIGIGFKTFVGAFTELTYTPSISYSDDFATDTVTGANGRYQAVTGTVAYDDVNKRMNVTTATGANGKASGRLKSYKFCEGSQIYDVPLPTGADGDFICLATHSANGLMTDGIGVGLQSDGAGNWNLATLSGTTVTEGADSGLDDADVARIEIEKDVTGAYWYYIYDAAGAKPTTPTGKLFTTRTEGYIGWFANGAGPTTQTYAIDNISIRAESIVGRTNVEVTEPFWFLDEFGDANSLNRTVSSSGWSISDGDLLCSTEAARMTFPFKIKNDDVRINAKCTAKGESDRYELIFSLHRQNTNIAVPTATNDNRYLISIFGTSSTAKLEKYDTTNTIINTTGGVQSISLPFNTDFEIRIQRTDPSTFVLTINGVSITFSDSGTPYNDGGYLTLVSYRGTWEFHDLQISGTRVYNKPIHRGSMLETYHDGTQEVVGTTFIDDCQWDRSAEYTVSDTGSATWDVANGRITLTNVKTVKANSPSLGAGYYFFRFSTGTEKCAVVFLCGSTKFFYTNGYFYPDGGHQASNSFTINNGDRVEVAIISENATSWTILAYNVTTWQRVTISSLGYGYPAGTNDGTLGFNQYSIGTTVHLEYMCCIAAESSSTNGIAACIPPIGGGARYGVQEGASIEFTNKALRGDYDFNLCAKTTNPGETPYYEMFFKNTTDDSAIAADSTTLKNVEPLLATYTDFEQALNLKYADRDDTISVQVRRHTSAPDEVNTSAYIDFMAVVPTKEVI